MDRHNKYDIFISYRRRNTGDKAEHLKDLLEPKYKGRISFDRENLTGLFDVALARRIDGCKDFLLVIGKKSLEFEEKDFTQEQVDLYTFLGTCTQSEFEQKILELGPNAPIDFVRIEIARALNRKDLNIIPIVPESTESFKFSQLNLPKDILGIKRYEAVFYSDNPDALFKDVIPKILLRLHTKPANLFILAILFAVAVIAIVLCICFCFWKHQKERVTISAMRTELQEKHKSFLLQLNTDLSIEQMAVIDTILMNMSEVYPDSIWMSQFEFTIGQWHGLKGEPYDAEQKNMPITNVSYGDVCMFLADIGNMTNLQIELPSTEIWEYAARGGENYENTLYVGSDDVEKVAWYNDNSEGHAHPSDGQQGKDPNMLDLYDMSGNVSELCNSRFDESGLYTICGGNFNSPSSEVTTTSRKGFSTDAKDKTVGFRIIIRK